MKRWDILYKSKTGRINVKEEILKILLENRGYKTKKEIKEFINPKLENLTLDSVGLKKKDILQAINRIFAAIKKQEQIVIYGDYDVDGITASAILWETLFFDLKAIVTPYIPHRIDEGYGISKVGIDNLKKKCPNVKLIITVDNGIVANEAIDYANDQGIDVLITDHHLQSEKLPDAYSIVHTTKLCGAGIAYLLSKELKLSTSKTAIDIQSKTDNQLTKLSDLSQPDSINKDTHLELAALGTIADLVPLKNGNRIIVKYGLEKLRETKRPGLLALFSEAGIDQRKIGAYEVGHQIAPRLNATGRMESAMESLRLICTKDQDRAIKLASLLGRTNKERQNVMLNAVNHASLSVKAKSELKKLLIVTHDSYPEGVIGLVAGRLVEEYYRPSIVISKGANLSKGSVRSINGFNIIEFLRQFEDLFVNIGGHPMAAGFTIETNKIEQMQNKIEQLAEAIDDKLYIRSIRLDCEIQLEHIDNDLYSKLQTLTPYGMNNPEPTFKISEVEINDMRIIGKEGKHLKLVFGLKSFQVDGIGFGLGSRASEMNIGDRVDIAFTINENEWNGRTKLQLIIKDIKKTEAIANEAEVE